MRTWKKIGSYMWRLELSHRGSIEVYYNNATYEVDVPFLGVEKMPVPESTLENAQRWALGYVCGHLNTQISEIEDVVFSLKSGAQDAV